jgi:hypothetical protein
MIQGFSHWVFSQDHHYLFVPHPSHITEIVHISRAKLNEAKPVLRPAELNVAKPGGKQTDYRL